MVLRWRCMSGQPRECQDSCFHRGVAHWENSYNNVIVKQTCRCLAPYCYFHQQIIQDSQFGVSQDSVSLLLHSVHYTVDYSMRLSNYFLTVPMGLFSLQIKLMYLKRAVSSEKWRNYFSSTRVQLVFCINRADMFMWAVEGQHASKITTHPEVNSSTAPPLMLRMIPELHPNAE